MVDSVAQLSAFRQPPRPSASVAFPRPKIARPVFLLHPISEELAPSSLLDLAEATSFLVPLKELLSVRLCKASFEELGASPADEDRITIVLEVREEVTGTIPSRAHDPRAPPIVSEGNIVRDGLATDRVGGAAKKSQLILTALVSEIDERSNTNTPKVLLNLATVGAGR